MTIVSIARQENYLTSQLTLKIEEILSSSGILNLIHSKKVLIKPNISGSFYPKQGRTTHPTVLKSLIEILRDHNAKISIAESSSVGTDTLQAAKISGIAAVAEETHTPFINFKHSKYHQVKIPNGFILDTIHLPQEIISVDYIISLAKMKTNYVSTISCSVKNMKGILKDSEKRKFHHIGLSPAVADLISYFDNVVAVVDGIVGSELYEPLNGNVLVASKDPLAADSICAKIIGIDPHSVEHLRLAYQKIKNISPETSSLELRGDLLSSVLTPFQHTYLGAQQLGDQFGVQITEGKYCSSCLGALYLCLQKTQQLHPQLLSESNTNIVLGKYCGPASSRDIYFGNCAKSSHSNRNLVPGCTPTTSNFIECLKNKIKTK